MHELSIAENIIKIIKKDYKEIERNIKLVSVGVGELTGIIPESLTYIFDIIKGNYELNNVELKVTMVKCKIMCENCGNTEEDYNLDSLQRCRACGSEDLRIIGGGDLTLLSIETSD